MQKKNWKTLSRYPLIFIVSAGLLALSMVLSAFPSGIGLAAPVEPGEMTLLGDSEPMGGLGDSGLCVNHTWVDVTSYQIKGTIGSQSKAFYTARAKLTFPDNSVKYAFCTDIHHSVDSNQTYCLDSGFYSDWRIAWLVNNYPPVADKEYNAARQAAIWHFSDGFDLNQNDPTTGGSSIDDKVKGHYNAILAAIPAQMPPEYEAGNVSLTITPQNATNFLPGQEQHPFTVTLMKGSKPLVGVTVNVTTSFGTLNQNSGVTDDNGQATFTVTSDSAGIATLTATAVVTVPAGSRFIHQSNPTGKQRLVLGEPIETTVQATASKTWENAQNLIIAHKFEDKNYNGVQDAGEPNLSGWEFTLTVPDETAYTATTGADGKAYFYDKVVANGTYTLTETLKLNWTNSTSLSQSKQRSDNDPWTQWIAHFGNAQYSLITVVKYEDKNGNKQQDDDEPTLSGWQFYLYKKSGSEWQQLTGGTTGDDGSLSFSDLDAGDYKVTESLNDPEYYNTTGMSQEITLSYPEHKTLYFGNRRYDMDYGDLPDEIGGLPAYNLTLFSENGARHKPMGQDDVWLGVLRDAEYDGNPHSAAIGDDVQSANDEDGVTRGPSWGGGTGRVFVTVTGPSCLMGWVDFATVNSYNEFLDFGPDFQFTEVISGSQTYNEKVIDNLYLDAGTHELTFNLPSDFASTSVFARFRLSPLNPEFGIDEETGQCQQPAASLNGLVIGGEVEDYYWSFGSTAVELKKISATPQPSVLSFGLIATAAGMSFAAVWFDRRRRSR
jgi:hypothetical protein